MIREFNAYFMECEQIKISVIVEINKHKKKSIAIYQ